MTGFRVSLAAAAIIVVASRASADLTEAQALERARAFLRAVGAADAASDPVRLETDPRRTDAMRVVFASGTWVSVQSNTGKVVWFSDYRAMHQDDTQKRITEEEAKACAVRYVHAAGITLADAVFSNVSRSRAGEGEIPAALSATWDRAHKGYRVIGDSLNVLVDAQTGALIALGEWFVSNMPADITPRLTPDEAVAAAASATGLTANWNTELLIVQLPNSMRAHLPDHCGVETRLAWLAVPASGGVNVTIDAMTGEILEKAVPAGFIGRSTERHPGAEGRTREAVATWAAVGTCLLAIFPAGAWLVIRRVRSH